MSPGRIAAAARGRGIDLLALTDHNASLNCPAFAIACVRESIVPLFGMELCSMEEVHLLAIFAAPREALEFGAAMYALLPDLPWDPAAFGDQVAVDEDENVLAMPERWLGAALEAPFDDLAARAHAVGALVIPAHVDRGMFSVYSQLGFLPPGPYDAVESMWRPAPSPDRRPCGGLGLRRALPRACRQAAFHRISGIGSVRSLEGSPRGLCRSLRRRSGSGGGLGRRRVCGFIEGFAA